MDERHEAFFSGEAHVLLVGNAAEQGDDVPGKAAVPYKRGFPERACGGPAYAQPFEFPGGPLYAVAVGIGLDDGHEFMALFHQYPDIMAKMLPVDVYAA